MLHNNTLIFKNDNDSYAENFNKCFNKEWCRRKRVFDIITKK